MLINEVRLYLSHRGEDAAAPFDASTESFAPWTSQLLRAFSGRGLRVRRLVLSVLVAAGAYILAPVLDISSYLFRSYTWADTLNQMSAVVFVTGAAMSLAASWAGLANWQSTVGLTKVRISARHAILVGAMILLVIANISFRFLPDSPRPHLWLIILDLALLSLFIISAWIAERFTAERVRRHA